LEVVKYLLSVGASHNSSNNPNKLTPFYCAIERGRFNCASYILSLGGVDVNQLIATGVFPLYIASQKGFVDIVKLLLENGANVNMKFKGKFTAEQIARTKKQTTVLKLLQAHASGKPLNIEREEGCIVM